MPVVCPSCGSGPAPGARFCSACGAALGALGPAPVVHDELRPITALFADIVGSTSLGERLAPDEVKALVGECVSRMSRAVEEFGGIIQAYQGDGICAYFGVPAAHEDDAERAARAALEILEVVREYAHDIEEAWDIAEFDVRVGINSGRAAVGLVGAGAPQEVALGDATNVAARLQSTADPGTVAIGETTARLLEPRFVLEPLGDVQLKGRVEAVAVWRLLHPRIALRPAAATPLVGRDGEQRLLGAAVDELIAGRGQIVLLSGEAGLGKSRLLAELQVGAHDRVTWLEGDCVSYGGELPLWPFAEMLRTWLGVEDALAEIAVRTKARAKLGALFGEQLDDVLGPLSRVLGVRVEPGVQPAAHPSDAEVRYAYRAWLERLAEERPLVVVLEDAHWADPATRELAEELLELTDRAPVLLAATMRVDPSSEGGRLRLAALARFGHRTIDMTLGPLPQEATQELLAALLPGGLDEAAQREILARAEGNPLYLEELLHALIEGAGLERRRTWTLTLASSDLLPPALEGLLVARIDRLPEAPRHLAQVAAVIGRTFPARVLKLVIESESLEADLTTLLRAEVIRELRRFPELEYSFKHGLLREAALSTLNPAHRRELYGRVAAAYESLLEDTLDEHLERVAYYHARSDQPGRAIEELERAGELAAQRGAHEQATVLWERARRLAEQTG